jgi:urocanate hydratase
MTVEVVAVIDVMMKVRMMMIGGDSRYWWWQLSERMKLKVDVQFLVLVGWIHGNLWMRRHHHHKKSYVVPLSLSPKLWRMMMCLLK